MSFQSIIDSFSIPGVFLVFAGVSLAIYEVGFRIGRWWQSRTPEEVEGPTTMLVGSLLALMAFLLAITMGMASERFDSRRANVLDEANAIGTTYLRAGYLPEPAATASRELVREYVPLRIASDDLTVVEDNIRRSSQIQQELWTIAEDLARETPDSIVLGLYIDSLNETLDASTTRVTAGLFARVPGPVLGLLVLGSMLTMGMVGYNAGLTRRRSPLTALGMIVVLGAVITLVVDLDRAQEGFVQVSQVPLEQLQQQVGPPGS
jgi:hypothetical protein